MNKDKELLIENLAILTDSGMDIMSALDDIKQEIHSSGVKKFIEKIQEKIDGGAPLWSTLQDSKFLPAASISLIRIGELSGSLAKNLNLVALQSQKERSFDSKVHSAMIYPMLVFGLTMTLGIGIAWFILPRLATVFTGLKIKLPFITAVLIQFGIFLQKNGFYVIPFSLFILGGLVYFLFFYEKTKFIGLRFAFALPVINRLMQEVEIARFSYILGTLLNAGLPIMEAMNSICQATTLPFYKKIYLNLYNNISEGNSFQKAFMLEKKLNNFIPHVIQQVIVAGEKSGNLAKSLLKVSQNYEEKTEITAKNLTVLLEPIMLIIIWLGVMAVALAVILPIYSLIGNLNNNL